MTLLLLTELIGTAAFAVSGALVGLEKQMDLFGVVVLGVTTAVGGGIIRDILLGATPPAAFQSPVFLLCAFGVSVITHLSTDTAGDGRCRSGQLHCRRSSGCPCRGTGRRCVSGLFRGCRHRHRRRSSAGRFCREYPLCVRTTLLRLCLYCRRSRLRCCMEFGWAFRFHGRRSCFNIVLASVGRPLSVEFAEGPLKCLANHRARSST